MTTPLYMLICENDAIPTLAAGRSIEASEQDGMTTARRAAEVIFRGQHNGDRVVRVVRLDLSDLSTLDVTREVAEHVQTRLGPYVLDERDDYEVAISFVEAALSVTLDGDRWIPDAVASYWLRSYGAESKKVAA